MSALPDQPARLIIGLLGAGRVAQQLAPALAAAGHRVVGIWSREPSHAQALADQCAAQSAAQSATPSAERPAVLASPADVTRLHPDVVLVAVPDHAVAAVITAAQLPPTLPVAHTAGTLPLPAHPRAGVLYPLQTFSADRVLDLSIVPFFLEATDAVTATLLETLAGSLSRRAPVWLTTAERAPLHLAAVFASNFPNHLLGVSALILERANQENQANQKNPTLTAPLPFDLLRPLVEEVVAKAFAALAGPFSVQTGPATRHDETTLTAHRARLAADDTLAPWLPVYEALTTAIQRTAADNAPPPPAH